jgi:hypothetical protein
MGDIVLAGSTSGTTTLTPAAVSGTTTLTLPATTSTLSINGPAFSAYVSTTQTNTTGVATKITFQTEEFDTANAFDSTTNYRFTPLVAGYYQVSAAYNTDSTALTRANIVIYKNGSAVKSGADYSSYTGINTLTVSALISMNGSTDYLEVYSLQTGTVVKVFASQNASYFQATMVRSA